MVLQRVIKPKNQRVKRALERREPKINENTKTSLFIKGGRTSDQVAQALKNLFMFKKPDAQLMSRKNIMRPFEDETSIEFLSDKNDASLFLFGSHSKKRPHNLVFGRLFDNHVLDMVELGIVDFKAIETFKSETCAAGTKPCLLFAGEAFDSDADHRALKNLLIDFFRGPVIEKVRLAGLEHVLTFTAVDGKVHLRTYRVSLKKSGCRTPRVELEEMGPSLDLVVRRTKLASEDLAKRARRRPKTAKPRKKKNVSMDVFGTKVAQIHMQKQHLDKLQTRKMKGLKRQAKAPSSADTSVGPKQARPSDTDEQSR